MIAGFVTPKAYGLIHPDARQRALWSPPRCDRCRRLGNRDRKNGTDYDYIHSLVDDHSRLAYAEIHDDEWP